MDFVGIAAILFGIAEIIKASAKVIQSIEEQTQMRPMVRRCRQQLRATDPTKNSTTQHEQHQGHPDLARSRMHYRLACR